MDLGPLHQNAGALLVGGLWALYSIGNTVWRDSRERKKQKDVDSAASALVRQLSGALDTANKLIEAGRQRNEEQNDRIAQMSGEVGELRAELKNADAERTKLREEVKVLTSTVEQLVVENRNKDRSISELVALNRKLLQTIGCTTPASEG